MPLNWENLFDVIKTPKMNLINKILVIYYIVKYMYIFKTAMKFNVHLRIIGRNVESYDTIALIKRKYTPGSIRRQLKSKYLAFERTFTELVDFVWSHLEPSRRTSLKNILEWYKNLWDFLNLMYLTAGCSSFYKGFVCDLYQTVWKRVVCSSC